MDFNKEECINALINIRFENKGVVDRFLAKTALRRLKIEIPTDKELHTVIAEVIFRQRAEVQRAELTAQQEAQTQPVVAEDPDLVELNDFIEAGPRPDPMIDNVYRKEQGSKFYKIIAEINSSEQTFRDGIESFASVLKKGIKSGKIDLAECVLLSDNQIDGFKQLLDVFEELGELSYAFQAKFGKEGFEAASAEFTAYRKKMGRAIYLAGHYDLLALQELDGNPLSKHLKAAGLQLQPNSYIIMPVQRLPRHCLLSAELVNNSNEKENSHLLAYMPDLQAYVAASKKASDACNDLERFTGARPEIKVSISKKKNVKLKKFMDKYLKRVPKGFTVVHGSGDNSIRGFFKRLAYDSCTVLYNGEEAFKINNHSGNITIKLCDTAGTMDINGEHSMNYIKAIRDIALDLKSASKSKKDIEVEVMKDPLGTHSELLSSLVNINDLSELLKSGERSPKAKIR